MITEVYLESEFLLGKEQERIFVMMTTKYLDTTVNSGGKNNEKAVTDALNVSRVHDDHPW